MYLHSFKYKCHKLKAEDLHVVSDNLLEAVKINDILEDTCELHVDHDVPHVKSIQCIILDCSLVNRFDETGIDILKKVRKM